MWPFSKSKTKTAHPATLQEVAGLAQSWLARMQELLDARDNADPSHVPAIDEKIDQLCQEAAEDVETTRGGGLSVRLQRMKQLTLEEMYKLSDRARQQKP